MTRNALAAWLRDRAWPLGFRATVIDDGGVHGPLLQLTVDGFGTHTILPIAAVEEAIAVSGADPMACALGIVSLRMMAAAEYSGAAAQRLNPDVLHLDARPFVQRWVQEGYR